MEVRRKGGPCSLSLFSQGRKTKRGVSRVAHYTVRHSGAPMTHRRRQAMLAAQAARAGSPPCADGWDWRGLERHRDRD